MRFLENCYNYEYVVLYANERHSNIQVQSFDAEEEPAPPPPPLPPPSESAPSTPVATLKRSPSVKSTAALGSDKMQDELAVVLSIVRDKPRLEIRQTPPVYISQKSTALEVQKWLKDKEFSKEVTEKLRGYTGHGLMSMTREQTEKICGLQEGRRLYSQISIQKSVSGVSILSGSFYKNSAPLGHLVN